MHPPPAERSAELLGRGLSREARGRFDLKVQAVWQGARFLREPVVGGLDWWCGNLSLVLVDGKWETHP